MGRTMREKKWSEEERVSLGMRPEEQEFRGILGRPILQIFIFYAAI
jgi:hypothetical protein